MFSRFIAFVLLVNLTIFATATTTIAGSPISPAPIPASRCNTGNMHCCDALERSDGSVAGTILGLLGVVIQGVGVLVGLHCTPLDILGIGQNSCHAQPVCCENNYFEGLIVIACTPISISL
ncbi:hypothetical protein M413DRAFT_25697 [Hebeloma cylindrosporum]|uniref:Hydrophobin n=1 Tax=Hebeloma cylindrosporum TaxID=76867 RepID=A0A0C2YTE0_HEBCY|nr:hypothetical protein M413DRAFT_25697 [Hebeloma cylindrosporum h7]